MKKAIISGATGALGMALIRELTGRGTDVLVLIRKNSKRMERLRKFDSIRILECSLEQYASMENPYPESFDVFYHFAWEGTTGADRNDMFLQNRNVKYALDAVALAKRFGCHTFVGSGSQAEYGRSSVRLKPDSPAFPENGYGIAKLCAGNMTRILAHQLGMKHVWTRILSLYGPCDGNQSLIMSLIASLEAGETPKCTKGEQVWDYLFSEDAAVLFRMIGEMPVDGKTYVIGSGSERPLADYIRDVRDAVRPDSEIAFGAVPYGDRQVMYLTADISEQQKDYQWMPQVGFQDGIRKIMEYRTGEIA